MQTFHSILLKAFSSDTPQSTKHQDKGPKNHDGKLWIEKVQSEKCKHKTSMVVESVLCVESVLQ